MKTDKEINKQETLTPREAAKNFIRPYLEKGDTNLLHPYFCENIEMEDYSAHVENKNIVVVTKLYGANINEGFPIREIMREVVMGNTKQLFMKSENSSPKKEYEKREQEINFLLIKLKYKLKKHKVNFLKLPSNWSYVGDLGYIAEVLREIV